MKKLAMQMATGTGGAWAESICMFDEQGGRQSSWHLVTVGRITAKEVGEEAADLGF